MFQPDFAYITNVPKIITYVPNCMFKDKSNKRKGFCLEFFGIIDDKNRGNIRYLLRKKQKNH
jgi:hypothetical protein